MLSCNQNIMLSEGEITNEIKNFLIQKKWFIIQYSPPGGSLGNPYKLNDENIYIDIVAIKDQIAVIFENKSIFNKKDIEKLVEIKNDDQLINKINFFTKIKNKNPISCVFFFHGHNHVYCGNKFMDINLSFLSKDHKIKSNFEQICNI